MGQISNGFHLRVPNVFFLSPQQIGLSATYPAPISTIVEIKDLNWFPHAYTGEEFPNFCAGDFSHSKNS